MKNQGKLTVTTPTDREILMTRAFDAPRRLVFDALTRPELLERWCFGPDGWSMSKCEMDLRPGGAYRYVWRRDRDGFVMGMGGIIREIVPPERLVTTEIFDEAWYPGEAVVTSTLVEKAGKTTLTLALLYESKEARDIALRSGMERGMEAGYDRLEEQVLAPALRKSRERADRS